MSIPVYVINLDRSPERLEAVTRSAEKSGIALKRVPAVDGALLPKSDPAIVDVAGFRRFHGKHPQPGEIGCYLSHLRALEQIRDGADPVAVIIEDDVVFKADFVPFVAALAEHDGWDMVKLVNHRTVLYRPHMRIGSGHTIGRCGHGPVGSSAAYAVTREGAGKLIAALTPMRLPYDVALERGWSGHYRAFVTGKRVVGLVGRHGSTIIASPADYARVTLPRFRRLPTLAFRSIDYGRRLLYALARPPSPEGRGR